MGDSPVICLIYLENEDVYQQKDFLPQKILQTLYQHHHEMYTQMSNHLQ